MAFHFLQRLSKFLQQFPNFPQRLSAFREIQENLFMARSVQKIAIQALYFLPLAPWASWLPDKQYLRDYQQLFFLTSPETASVGELNTYSNVGIFLKVLCAGVFFKFCSKKNQFVLTIQIISIKSGDSNCFSQICICVLLPYDTPYPLGKKLNMYNPIKCSPFWFFLFRVKYVGKTMTVTHPKKSLWDLKPALALGVECWKVIWVPM